MRICERVFCVVLSVAFAGLGFGAVFNVNSFAGLQSALSVCESNGESDVINVLAGTYNITGTLRFNSTENFALEIVGAGVAATVLDGQNLRQILNIYSTELAGQIRVRKIKFINGMSGAEGGGALFIETVLAEILVDSCEFSDDSCDAIGGGASVVSASGYVRVENSSFLRNRAQGAGGLNAASGEGDVRCAGCRFEFNRAYGNETFYGDDGGGNMLYSDGGDIVMTGCTFRNNVSEDDGGGGFAYTNGSDVSITVSDNIFFDNAADLGGAGCFVRSNGRAAVTFHNNRIEWNSASDGSGGGVYIYIDSGDIVFSENALNYNSCGENGGGCAIWNGGGTGVFATDAANNYFSFNTAAQNGGGLDVATGNANVTVYRNAFFNNNSSVVGGGISLATESGTLSAYNNTSYADTASEGGAICFYCDAISAHAECFNNIFWNSQPPAFAASGAIPITARYCDIYRGLGEEYFGIGCIDTDPLFISPSSGNLRLSWLHFPTSDFTKSPCIDTGDPTSAYDHDGTRADIGAYAFDQVTAVSESFSEHAETDALICTSFSNNSNTLSFIVQCNFNTNVSISIFDILGRNVANFADAFREAQTRTITFDTQILKNGVYFYKLHANNDATRGKFIVVR